MERHLAIVVSVAHVHKFGSISGQWLNLRHVGVPDRAKVIRVELLIFLVICEAESVPGGMESRYVFTHLDVDSRTLGKCGVI